MYIVPSSVLRVELNSHARLRHGRVCTCFAHSNVTVGVRLEVVDTVICAWPGRLDNFLGINLLDALEGWQGLVEINWWPLLLALGMSSVPGLEQYGSQQGERQSTGRW